MRVGVGEWSEGEFAKQNSQNMAADKTSKSRQPLFSFQFIENEEQGHFGATKSVRLEEIGYMDKLPCPARGDKGRGASSNRNESFLHCQVDTEGATRVLIVSDEVTGTHDTDETQVRCNLANIRREILYEEDRRSKIVTLNQGLLESSVDLTTSPGNMNTADLGLGSQSIILSPIDEIMVHPHVPTSPADSIAIGSELQEIVDHDEGML